MRGDVEQPSGDRIPTSEKVMLRVITADTLDSILNLRVAEDQEQFVASNAKSIAQAHDSDSAWYRAIYAGDTPVGFVMLYIDEEKPEYYIWRFMIGEQYQRMGYGSQAMSRVLEHVRTLPNAKEVRLSYFPAEGEPLPFYERFSFVETGEWEHGEKVMALTLKED